MHLLSQSDVLRALGWCLFDSLWQMAFLWLLYTSFINVFKNASANTRHGLAFMLLGIGAGWSLITFLQAFFSPSLPGIADWLTALIADAHNRSGLLSLTRQWLQTALPWFAASYLLFLGFLFIHYSGQYLHARRLKDTGLSRIAAGHRLFVDDIRCRMNIKKPVNVWLSELADSPITLGFFKPVILIPVATIGNLSTSQAEAILLHELAHIKRNDYLLNLGVTLLGILFFFNPFCRWIIRDIRREREHCCDDLVMQFRYDPHDYVSALLSLARNQGAPQLALAATGNNDRLLLRRARRILQLPSNHDRPGSGPIIFLICTFLLTGLIGLGLSSWSPDQLDNPHLISFLPSFNTSDESSARPEAGATSQPESRKTEISVITFSSVHIKTKPGTPVFPAKPGMARPLPAPAPDAADEETAAAVSADNDEGGSIGHFVTDVQDDKREYSITTSVAVAPATVAPPPDSYQDKTPYVPNSSFSYSYIQDSARPDQQFVYLHKLASQDAALAVKRMEKELQLQLHILSLTHSDAEKQLILEKRQILEEQLKLQQQYLQRQQELLNKYEKLGKSKKLKVRRIVDI